MTHKQAHSWGGYRPGSGRRPKGEVSGVSHHTRTIVSARHPVRVTMRTKPELGNLRRSRVHEVIRAALAAVRCDAGEPGPFRICHYSLQKHGLLLLVEARDRAALSRGMQGVSVRIAKSLNRLWERNGSVFADRYDTEVLKSSQAVRDSLCYVLNHARLKSTARQSGQPGPGELDPFSSAMYFDGWKHLAAPVEPPGGSAPVTAPRSSLLAVEWRKHGLLDVDEVPRQEPDPRRASA